MLHGEISIPRTISTDLDSTHGLTTTASPGISEL